MAQSEHDLFMVAVEKPVVQLAQFGPAQVSDVNCRECYDTGVAGGSAWTAGSRCEACRGAGALTRFLRAIRLGNLLAAPQRTL
jgi:hypothetical protein